MDIRSLVQNAREADDRRPDFPGEHWIVLGAGLLLLLAAGRGRSFIGRTLAGAAGSALVGRAASGRGGIEKVVKSLVSARR